MIPSNAITPAQLLRKKWYRLDYWLAFGLGSGLSPKAPGTMGTVIAVPLYMLLMQLSASWYALVMVATAAIGVWLCQSAVNALGQHDHKAIVWDEMVGYWWTMWLLPATSWVMLAAFIAFRLFDIWKPWPISWLDHHVKGGLGVMVDDLLAAVLANLSVCLLLYAHASLT